MSHSPEQNGTEVPWADRHKPLPFFLMYAGIPIITIAGVIASGSPQRWIGHALMAVVGLILLVFIIVTGLMLGNRIPSFRIPHIRILHKIAGTCFSGVVLGTFLLGLLIMVRHQEPILTTTHGILGLVVAILAGVQVLFSLLVTHRQSIRTPHRIIGYLIGLLFLLQLLLGISAAGLFPLFGE